MDAETIGILSGAATAVLGLLTWYARKAITRDESEAGVARKSLRLAEKLHEDTGRHVDGWVDCERRCAKLEGANAGLTLRLAELERENATLRGRVTYLEREVDTMRGAIDALMRGDEAPVAPEGRARTS